MWTIQYRLGRYSHATRTNSSSCYRFKNQPSNANSLGGFRLAPHAWDDPVERFTSNANKNGINYILPKIGVPFNINSTERDKWWTDLD